MKRLRIVFVVLLLLAGTLFALRGAIAPALMRVAAGRLVGADPIAALADGLHVTLCGAGSPLPDPARSGPCVGVVAGETLFVVDAGASASRNMARMGLPPDRTAAVFLTHFTAITLCESCATEEAMAPQFNPKFLTNAIAGAAAS